MLSGTEEDDRTFRNAITYFSSAILGTQVGLSPLRYLAKSIASSLIRLSNSCFLPILYRGILTSARKYLFRLFIKRLVLAAS